MQNGSNDNSVCSDVGGVYSVDVHVFSGFTQGKAVQIRAYERSVQRVFKRIEQIRKAPDEAATSIKGKQKQFKDIVQEKGRKVKCMMRK